MGATVAPESDPKEADVEFLIYGLLALATSIYALILEQVKARLEPDLTWLEVAIGVALVLSAPFVLARVAPADWATYEARVWTAFVVGGLPIVVWQFARHRRNATATRIEAQRLLLKDRTHGNTTAALAEPRGAQPADGEGDR